MTNSEYKKFIPEADTLKASHTNLTPADILGPFYRPGATFAEDLCLNADLTLYGTVKDESGAPVGKNAYIEFWQADENGKYDEAGQKFRGIQALGEDGSYTVRTIHPGAYDISEPADPQPHDFRCSHIHVKIWVDGRDILTTQLYFKGDKYNKTDHWFDERRVVPFTGKDGRFDFVVKK